MLYCSQIPNRHAYLIAIYLYSYLSADGIVTRSPSLRKQITPPQFTHSHSYAVYCNTTTTQGRHKRGGVGWGYMPPPPHLRSKHLFILYEYYISAICIVQANIIQS